MQVINRLVKFQQSVSEEYGGRNKFETLIGVSEGYLTKTLQKKNSSIGSDVIDRIVQKFPDLNLDWLVTGNGDMFKTDLPQGKYIALYDVEAAAGYESFDVMISKEKVVGEFVIPTFKSADWMIYVRGTSMYPKYSSGDIIACKEIKESRFIQWNKVYVVATREQGLLVKRLMPSDDENCIKAVSDNEKYPPFDIPEDEIFGIALVLGAIRLE